MAIGGRARRLLRKLAEEVGNLAYLGGFCTPSLASGGGGWAIKALEVRKGYAPSAFEH